MKKLTILLTLLVSINVLAQTDQDALKKYIVSP